MLVPAYTAPLQLLHSLFLPAIDPRGPVLSHPHVQTNGGHTENHTDDTLHARTVIITHNVHMYCTVNANMVTQINTQAHDASLDLCEQK